MIAFWYKKNYFWLFYIWSSCCDRDTVISNCDSRAPLKYCISIRFVHMLYIIFIYFFAKRMKIVQKFACIKEFDKTRLIGDSYHTYFLWNTRRLYSYCVDSFYSSRLGVCVWVWRIVHWRIIGQKSARLWHK